MRRRIVGILAEQNPTFSELMELADQSNHGKFGYHMRALKGFIRLDSSTGKYSLSESGWLLARLIQNGQRVISQSQLYQDSIRELGLRDHAVAFYITQDFRRNISLLYAEVGLSRDEAVLYLASENKLDVEKKAMTKYGIDLDKLKAGAFEIMSSYKWYIEKGKAQAETRIANWLELVEKKEGLGFKGLRGIGDTGVFFDYGKSEEVLRYEESLDKQQNSNMCALCLYDLRRLEEDLFIRIYKSHHKVIGLQYG